MGALVLAAVVAPCRAQAGDEMKNWFDDPFFQISSALADCPLPAGPFTTEGDRSIQAHRRAEKGTSCWLASECDRPSAYAHDRDIASAFQAAVRRRHPVPKSTLWVTVQARVVYVEGCTSDPASAARIEAFARALPDVHQAIAIVRTRPGARPPYRLRHPAR